MFFLPGAARRIRDCRESRSVDASADDPMNDALLLR
jgi:hypothetical protein